MEEYGVSEALLDMLLSLTKQRLGIMSDVRNSYVEPRILASLFALLKDRNIALDLNNTNHMMLIVDYTVWEYQSVTNHNAMPAHIRYRLNDLLVKPNV